MLFVDMSLGTSQYTSSLWKHHRFRFHYRIQNTERRAFHSLMDLRAVQIYQGLQRPSLLHPLMMAGDTSTSISQLHGVSFAGGHPSSASDLEMVLQCSNSKISSLRRQNTETICPEGRCTTQETWNFVSIQVVKNGLVDFFHGIYIVLWRNPRLHDATPLDHPPFQQTSHLWGWTIITTSLAILRLS